MSDTPNEVWKSLNVLNDLIHGHHKNFDIMRFKTSDGSSSLSDSITGSNIIFHEMARLDFNMYIGRNNKPSKTEVVFSLPEKL